MDVQRVNKVTVSLMDDGESCKLTMYRTNTKLGEVSNTSIGVPSFTESKLANKQLYMNYCRDTMINLLKNNGVEGFFYDAENRASNSGLPKKFTKSLFVQHGKDMLYNTLEPMQKNLDGKLKLFDVLDNDDDLPVTITETYADQNIKYGEAQYKVEFEHVNNVKKQVSIPVSIKSGQLCKPKVMILDDNTEKNITANNILGLFEDKSAPKEKENKGITIKPEVAQQVVHAPSEDTANEESLPITQAPINQEFEGDKPVVDKDNDADIVDKVNSGEEMSQEDWEKLRKFNKQNKNNHSKVSSVMNAIKGEK